MALYEYFSICGDLHILLKIKWKFMNSNTGSINFAVSETRYFNSYFVYNLAFVLNNVC